MSASDRKVVIWLKLKVLTWSIRSISQKVWKSLESFKKSIWRSVTTPKIRKFFEKIFSIFSKLIVMVRRGHFCSFYVNCDHFESIWNKINGWKSKKSISPKKKFRPLGGTRLQFWWSEVLSWVKFSQEKHFRLSKRSLSEQCLRHCYP